MTAFDLIGTAPGLNLSAMFERGAAVARTPTRFASAAEPGDILAAVRAAAAALGFAAPAESRNFKLRMEGPGRRGPLVALAQVFEMCPGLHMLEVRKVRGDTLEYGEFYRRLEERCAPLMLARGKPEAEAGVPVPPRVPSSGGLSNSV